MTQVVESTPNILLLMCDDLGYGDTGFNGNDIIQTPSLDKLRSEGAHLTRFFAGAPVCSPTRGTCLTGRHQYRYGITTANDGKLPTQEVTLSKICKESGYRTGHFGKWHLGTLTTTSQDGRRAGPEMAPDLRELPRMVLSSKLLGNRRNELRCRCGSTLVGS